MSGNRRQKRGMMEDRNQKSPRLNTLGGNPVQLGKEVRGMRFADRGLRIGNFVPLRMEAKGQKVRRAEDRKDRN